MNTTCSTKRTLADYTAVRLIFPRLNTSTMQEVTWELAQALREAIPTLPDLVSDSRAALQRALLTGVDLTTRAVFPRIQVAELQWPRFAVGQAAEPFDWLAKPFPPMELVFLIAEPSVSTPESELLVETLTRLRRQQLILNELRSAPTAEAKLMVLERFPMVSAEELALAQAQRLRLVSRYASHNLVREHARRR